MGPEIGIGELSAPAAWSRGPAVIAGWVVIAVGVGVLALRFVGEEPPARNAESFTAAFALGAVIAAPGVLALIAARLDRPALLLPAALVLVPLSFISFALVTLPLLIPAFLLARQWWRSMSEGVSWRAITSSLTAMVLLIAALAVLFIGTTTRRFQDATMVHETTGWIPWSTSIASLALVAAAVVTATWLSAEQRPRRS